MKEEHPEWFSTWFDSPYYHILYKDRDQTEAQDFIHTLISHFQVKPPSKILDLACGKGRHALYLSKLGYEVTGIDLSKASISHAKQFETDLLHFEVHDMRMVYQLATFDYVLNLFTSFGYFDTDEEHLQTLKAVKQNLKAGGIFILDFLNATHAIENLRTAEIIQRDHLEFIITREVRNGYILKTIQFKDHEIDYFFQEKVKALYPHDFEDFFKKAGLEVLFTFGDYQLHGFESLDSPRLIYVLRA